MTPVTMLDRIIARGVKVKYRSDGSVVLLGASKLPPVLAAEIRANGPELKHCAALRWCHRCETINGRTTLAYWSETERYCVKCCAVLANEFDASRSWPTPPWTLDDLETIGETKP
jgi:hypothetical protein